RHHGHLVADTRPYAGHAVIHVRGVRQWAPTRCRVLGRHRAELSVQHTRSRYTEPANLHRFSAAHCREGGGGQCDSAAVEPLGVRQRGEQGEDSRRARRWTAPLRHRECTGAALLRGDAERGQCGPDPFGAPGPGSGQRAGTRLIVAESSTQWCTSRFHTSDQVPWKCCVRLVPSGARSTAMNSTCTPPGPDKTASTCTCCVVA